MRARTLPCLVVLCLLGAGCTSESPTGSAVHPVGAPLLDGIGWVGGGGKSDDSTDPTTSTTSAGIGWVGGGGRAAEDDSLTTAP